MLLYFLFRAFEIRFSQHREVNKNGDHINSADNVWRGDRATRLFHDMNLDYLVNTLIMTIISCSCIDVGYNECYTTTDGYVHLFMVLCFAKCSIVRFPVVSSEVKRCRELLDQSGIRHYDLHRVSSGMLNFFEFQSCWDQIMVYFTFTNLYKFG